MIKILKMSKKQIIEHDEIPKIKKNQSLML